jgi:hypothetical protein
VKPADYWKRVREVCDKATAGPWKAMRCGGTSDYDGRAYSVNHESAVDCYDSYVFKSDAYDECSHIVDEEDAAFIALARTALPEALDEIERLRTALLQAFLAIPTTCDCGACNRCKAHTAIDAVLGKS